MYSKNTVVLVCGFRECEHVDDIPATRAPRQRPNLADAAHAPQDHLHLPAAPDTQPEPQTSRRGEVQTRAVRSSQLVC